MVKHLVYHVTVPLMAFQSVLLSPIFFSLRFSKYSDFDFLGSDTQ